MDMNKISANNVFIWHFKTLSSNAFNSTGGIQNLQSVSDSAVCSATETHPGT